MKKYDALRFEAAALEMVEGTGLSWWDVIRHIDGLPISLNLESYVCTELELALGIIEGKPVWDRDTIYIDGAKTIIGAHSTSTLHEWNKVGLVSWNPPTPKTVMVELTMEEVIAYSGYGSKDPVGIACRKALEGLK